jgi:hypothetical protein
MTQPIESAAFDDLITELKRQPLQDNKYRTTAGSGHSQAFGIVNRRCLPPDYSRQNWCRPYLYHLLLEFGKKYVKIPFNSVTVNQNYRADKHRDKNNRGESFLVAFGSYTGGELLIHEGDLSGSHSVWCKPMVTDFSKVLHSVDHFTGERYSLVFYWFETSRSVELPPPSVREENGKWFFYRGEDKITRQIGLPHPLRGKRKKSIQIGIQLEEKEVEVGFP